jgi:hypothetical protein
MDPTNLALVDNRLPLNPKLTSILDLQLESVSMLQPTITTPPLQLKGRPLLKKSP